MEILTRRTAATVMLAAALLRAPLASTAQAAPSDAPAPGDQVHPPWGDENDVRQRGLEFTVPEADVLADFHGDPINPRLALFVGGNYFFAMPPLVRAFEARHPEFAGHIYWETLPPGLLAEQIAAGGRVTSGAMTWTVRPDVYLAGLDKVRALKASGVLAGEVTPYAVNDLTIMVPAGNPAGIRSLADLARPGLRIAMPNPQFEGVARQIKAALAASGGPGLVTAVYETKVASGETILTRIHHRQTPMFLMQGNAMAGVTWRSEAVFQEAIGHPIGHVDIPAAQNATGAYAGAEVRGAPHPAAARAWLAFIRSPEAQVILARYGFKPYVDAPAR